MSFFLYVKFGINIFFTYICADKDNNDNIDNFMYKTTDDVKNIPLEEVDSLTRGQLYDIYKLIKPYGALSDLAALFGYKASADIIRKICKGEGTGRRYNHDLLEYMRDEVRKYIKKHKSKEPKEADALAGV